MPTHIVPDYEENSTPDTSARESIRNNYEKYLHVTTDIHAVLNFAGLILRVNPAVEKVLGYPRDTVVHKPLTFIVQEKNHQKVEEGLKKLRNGEVVNNLEMPVLSADGTIKWLMTSAFPVPDEKLIFLTSRDITEKKQLDVNFETLFNLSPVMKTTIRIRDLRYLAVNNAWLNTLGYTRGEVLGRTPVELGVVSETLAGELRQAVTEKKSLSNFPAKLMAKTGEARDVLMSSQFILLGSEPCILNASLDITEQKAMEREMFRLERLNVIGQMAGGIGHEIRNPLATVRGFLQLLQGDACFQEKHEYFDTMISELDRANQIITDFLSLSKWSVSEPEKISLNKLLKKLLPLMEADAFRQNMDISLSTGSVSEIFANEKEICQLILNLVKNALDASPPGERVELATYRRGGQTVLSVTDHGPGIEPGILERIGTPFVTTKETGTGLGLAICYSIAERHGARIEFNTGKDGTVFYVYFPETGGQKRLQKLIGEKGRKSW